jgi:hypothetical protein
MNSQDQYYFKLLDQLKNKVSQCAKQISKRGGRPSLVFVSNAVGTEVEVDLQEICGYLDIFVDFCNKMTFSEDKFYRLSRLAMVQQLNKVFDLIEVTGAQPYNDYKPFQESSVDGELIRNICESIVNDLTNGHVDKYNLYVTLLKNRMIHFYNTSVWVLRNNHDEMNHELKEFDFLPMESFNPRPQIFIDDQPPMVDIEPKATLVVVTSPRKVMKEISRMNEDVQTHVKQNSNPVIVFDKSIVEHQNIRNEYFGGPPVFRNKVISVIPNQKPQIKRLPKQMFHFSPGF